MIWEVGRYTYVNCHQAGTLNARRNVLLTYWAPGSSVGPPEMYSYLDLLGAWFLCGSSRNVLISWPIGRLVPLWVLPKCTHILTYWAPGSSVGPPEMYSYLDLLGAWFLCGSSRNVLISWPTGCLVPLWVLPKCTVDLLGAWFLCGSSRNVLLTYWAPGSSLGPPEMYSYLDLLGAWFLCGSSRNILISWPTGRLVPLWVLPKCTHILTYWAPGSSVGPPEMYSYLDLLGAWFLCGSSRNVLLTYWAPGFSVGPPEMYSWPTGRLVPLWKCTHILTYWAPGSSVEMYSWPSGRLVPLWVLPKCTHILTYWAPGSSVGPPEMYSYLDLLGAWFLCGSSRNVLISWPTGRLVPLWVLPKCTHILTYWVPGSSVGPPEMYCWPTGRLVSLWVLPKCTLDLLGAWFLCGNVLISWPTGRLVPL